MVRLNLALEFVTHAVPPPSVDFVLEVGELRPKLRYPTFFDFEVFALSVDGAYNVFNIVEVYFVFPWSVVRRYAVKPVLYHPYGDIPAMVPSRDKSVYYYRDRFAFEMELVSEEAIPLGEAVAAYVSPLVHSEYRGKLVDRLKKYTKFKRK